MEKEKFSEFEKLRQPLRAIPYREKTIIIPYFFAASVFIVFAILLIFWIVPVAVLMIIIGVIIGIYGYILQKQGMEKYSFYGVSRENITKAIEFMDSVSVSEDELESPVPYHDKKPRGNYEIYDLYHGLLKFMRRAGKKLTWPTDMEIEFKESIDQEKKNLIKASSLYLICVVPLISGAVIFNEVLFLILGLIIIISWIGFMCNTYRDIQDAWFEDIHFSETQELTDTIDSFLNLLCAEYHYPLRFILNKEYSQLTYTGRTKTTFTLIRLKEAIFYPQQASQGIE